MFVKETWFTIGLIHIMIPKHTIRASREDCSAIHETLTLGASPGEFFEPALTLHLENRSAGSLRANVMVLPVRPREMRKT